VLIGAPINNLIYLGVTQCTFSNRQAAKNAKILSMTPRLLGDFVNILGDLGFLAVQMRKS
jgi:hypothetical protein